MNNSYLDPASMTAESISNLNARKSSMSMVHTGLDTKNREEIIDEAQKLFQDVESGNLEFVTKTLSSHTMILNNIVKVCLEKANTSSYPLQYMQLSMRAMEQARKTGVAMAQVKNTILNIENLIIIQNNLVLESAKKDDISIEIQEHELD